MKIVNSKLNSTTINPPKIYNENESNVAFTAGPPLYAVKNNSAIKKVLPVVSFFGSFIGSIGYLIGGSALFYDLKYGEHDKEKNEKDGVKTIEPTTKFGKFGVSATKWGMSAISASGISCGIVEGLPLMTMGESIYLTSAPIIETPIGTGIFGISIGAIFAALGLENTPELRVNEIDLMAQKGFAAKTKFILNNLLKVGTDISKSVVEIAKNIFNPEFLKETFLFKAPKTVVFSEEINKEGKVFFSKVLRHKKNYFMNLATVILLFSGISIIASTLLDKKKAQKGSLKAEEGGFLFDNVAMTKFGIDKFTTGVKGSGSAFAVGGLMNAVAQFLGLDNLDGRGLQWLGIGFVFLGFAIDRGRTLRKKILEAKFKPELRRVVREWKVDISKLVDNSEQLKTLQNEIQSGKEITNARFKQLEAAIRQATGSDFKTNEQVRQTLEKLLGKENADRFIRHDVVDYNETKKNLEICTEKTFGSKNPTAVAESEIK